MSEQGSRVCFACTAYTGNRTELYGHVTDKLSHEDLLKIANYASTMARTISIASDFGRPLCALLLNSSLRAPENIHEAECTKQTDMTYRACSIPRNMDLYNEWLKKG